MADYTIKKHHWCFTFFAEEGEDHDMVEFRAHAKALFDVHAPFKYLIMGIEICPETQRPHLQGFVQFPEAMRLSKLKKVHRRISWHPRRGTPKQARDYCMKEGNFLEWGEFITREDAGERNRDSWARIRTLAIQGDLDTIGEEHPSEWIRSYRTLKQIKVDHMQLHGDLDGVCGVWICGPSGCGKSRRAREEYGQEGFYYKLPNKWWDGYQHQPAVIIEDFGKEHHVLGYHLKIWADRYAFSAEVKGGALVLRPEKIVVTSQYRIEDVWQDQETIDAISRRYVVVDMF